jgi:hypothetical protein
MKKLFTLIAVALCTLGANAEVTTDVSAFKNYLYLSVDGDIVAGQDNTFFLNIVQDDCGQSIGIEEITFPEGYVVKKFLAVKDNWAVDEETEEYYLALKPATINGNLVSAGILGGGSKSNYTAKECKIAKFTVAVPSDAAATCLVNMKQAEVSLMESYWKTNGYQFNKEVHDIDLKFTVTGADAISNVAADGTEAAAPAKKIVDGQLVIETANGTFNAAGAQVK